MKENKDVNNENERKVKDEKIKELGVTKDKNSKKIIYND